MATKGIPQIKIPIRAENLTITAVEPYLRDIFVKFKENAQKIREDYDYYCLSQSILSKVRTHDDTDINNIVVIPNVRSVIEWIVGYTIGQPIKYAQTKDNQTNDIEILNRHFRSSLKNKVDEEEITWALATGVGYTFTQPKTRPFNIKEEAPFEQFCVDSDSCAKVYSSYLGNAELFDILYSTYTEIDKDGNKQNVEVFDLYFPDKVYTYKGNIGVFDYNRVEERQRGLYRKLPLTEKRRDKDGIGIVSLGRDMADTMDMLISSGLDNIEEIINQFFVYYNVSLGDTPESQAATHKKAKKNGVIVIKSASKDLEGKLDTISPKLNLAEVRELYSLVNQTFHACVGVPMEMGETNSGGTTKQGSEVANGYDNAYTRFLKNTNYFTSADYQRLDKIMWIEKNTPDSGIDEISTFDIQIKYQPNLTDNIQTKAQAFGTLIQYMPPAMALRYTRMSGDPEAEGKLIEESEVYRTYIASKQKSETIDVKEENS